MRNFQLFFCADVLVLIGDDQDLINSYSITFKLQQKCCCMYVFLQSDDLFISLDTGLANERKIRSTYSFFKVYQTHQNKCFLLQLLDFLIKHFKDLLYLMTYEATFLSSFSNQLIHRTISSPPFHLYWIFCLDKLRKLVFMPYQLQISRIF